MNKPSFEFLQTFNNNSFLLRSFRQKAFTAPYHFHPEYELTLILKGKGKRFVGSNMADYMRDDLVLLGSNLPHCWKTEEIIEGEINAHSIVVQFSDDFLGSNFFSKPEFTKIHTLLLKSANGIQFIGEVQAFVKERMVTLVKEEDNFQQVINLLEILQTLATSDSFISLNSDTQSGPQSPIDQERINPVFAYLVDNFQHRVSLNEAASIANMSPNAFCKYFKKITRKTFMETVIAYRINFATQQLVYTNKPVSEICFDSGFTDLSHFYKMFRSKMKLSPLSYRKRFNKQV